MRERAIRLYDYEVRAVLAGRQTQLRRVVRPQPREVVPNDGLGVLKKWVWDKDGSELRPGHPLEWLLHNKCPHGIAGDRLWVQEIWTLGDSDGESFADIFYRAGGEKVRHEVPEPIAFKHREKLRWLEVYGNGRENWQSSTCMPRWASRITLEIVSVRAERLQEIRESGAVAGGVVESSNGFSTVSAREGFSILWDEVNGFGSWVDNSWVWVVEFRRVDDE